MFVFWALAGLVLTLCGQIHTGEIHYGREARKHSRPYMVLLEREYGEGCTKHCGGFLINEEFVITAAHCQAKSYNVYLGLHNYQEEKQGVQWLSVAHQYPYAGYNTCSLENDIMLLKLSSKANFTDNVKPIALAMSDGGGLPESCSVSGWGQTEKSPYMSPILKEVDVKLVENQKCAEKKAYCSADKGGPGKGDSGGPLVCEGGKAYGVVAANFKSTTCGPTLYLYTKISQKMDWIKNILKKNNSTPPGFE